jgi:hypothetical protein
MALQSAEIKTGNWPLSNLVNSRVLIFQSADVSLTFAQRFAETALIEALDDSPVVL